MLTRFKYRFKPLPVEENHPHVILSEYMVIRKAPDIRYSEVTPKSDYLNRRGFLSRAALVGGVLAGGAWADSPFGTIAKSPLSTNEKQNSLKDVSSYNNYYEFGTDKEQPAEN